MSSETGFFAALFGGLFGVIAVIVALSMWLSSVSCHAAAAKMQYPATWGPLQGCMIEVGPDKWVPGESYRYWPDGAE